MARCVLDSFAIIEYLDGSDFGEKVRSIIEKEENEILISSISFSEILSKILRQNKDVTKIKKILLSMGKIVDVNLEIAEAGAEIHVRMRKEISDFGLADALILATAKKNNAKLITGDKHFKNVKDVVYLD